MKIVLYCLSSVLIAGLAMVSSSCATPETPQPEPPPARGQRDRVMSELHGSRKLLTDAMAAANAETFSARGAEGAPSASEMVQSLVQLERNLQRAMQGSSASTVAHPLEQEGLSREDRQKLSEESAASMRTTIAACLAKYPPSAFRLESTSGANTKEDADRLFREVRDATIAYARETEQNLLRRQVEFPNCGQMDLMTSMMLQAELTAKVAEVIK